ncbi:MAG: HNH endonuclease [Bacteroidales bacterium]|nr:HNH endonuclease [Bacteroidales bacterium]
MAQRIVDSSLKKLKTEFLLYLEGRIPEYRMPANKFYSSFNASLKSFAKKQGRDISCILEIDDVSLLIDWQGKLGQNDNAVFNARRRETKAQEGLHYYIDFLNLKASEEYSNHSSVDSFAATSENTNEDVIEKATEGLRKEVSFFRRSRNRTIRNECAKKYNYKCCVCGMDFEKVYGPRGHEFIEVHHIKPLASYEGEHDIPLEDLRALCSNCHSIVHHGDTLMEVERLKEEYDKRKNNRDLY